MDFEQGRDVDVSVDDLINNLNMAFMGDLEARKSKWSLAADLIYLNVGAGCAGSVPIAAAPGGRAAPCPLGHPLCPSHHRSRSTPRGNGQVAHCTLLPKVCVEKLWPDREIASIVSVSTALSAARTGFHR